MKRFVSLLFLMTSVANAFATTINNNGIYYEINPDGYSVTLTGYDSYYCSGDIVIPCAFRYDLKSYSVTNISKKAFLNCVDITSMSIPYSVQKIGYQAFYGCTELQTVKFYTGIKYIDDMAFYGCSKLAQITIPNSVDTIGARAFYGCSNLKSVEIGSAVNKIWGYAFNNCVELMELRVNPDNNTLDSRNNCNAIIETSTNTLLYGCKSTTIPNTITSIGKFAFRQCKGITSITIPENVSHIGEGAFEECSALTTLQSDAINPPKLDRGAFYHINSQCVLKVPEEAIENYKSAEQWKNFLIIQPISGVKDISADDLDIQIEHSGIVNTGNQYIEVYNICGTKVYSGSDHCITLSKGVYIVRNHQKSKKIAL